MAARQRQTYGEEVANVLTHGAGMLFWNDRYHYFDDGGYPKWKSLGDRQFRCLCRLYDTFVCDVPHFTMLRPVHDRKDSLRRFDHGAIYLHIAGTYTPFTLLALRQEGYWVGHYSPSYGSRQWQVSG